MKIFGAAGLGILALFMLLGFLNSSAVLHAPATIAALVLTIGLPALGAGLLLRSHYAERSRIGNRKALLRQQTLETEVLRLAGEHGGKLTVMEVATQLGITPETAKEVLDALVVREHADLEVTDAGLLVYTFHDIRHLGGKSSAKGLLDA